MTQANEVREAAVATAKDIAKLRDAAGLEQMLTIAFLQGTIWACAQTNAVLEAARAIQSARVA